MYILEEFKNRFYSHGNKSLTDDIGDRAHFHSHPAYIILSKLIYFDRITNLDRGNVIRLLLSGSKGLRYLREYVVMLLSTVSSSIALPFGCYLLTKDLLCLLQFGRERLFLLLFTVSAS